MVNLVAGERVVEELIQEACTPDAVANETIDLLTNRERAVIMKEQLALVRDKLGGPGASARAAAAIVEVARRKTEVGGVASA
jgi:lipid-A-disaccharide synthase